MLSEQVLSQIINDQKEIFLKKEIGIPRMVKTKQLLETKRIVVITGIRRSGKSTLLRQIAKKLKSFYYINFDDERLFNFELSDFQKLILCFQKMEKSKTLLIDEIQNVPNWERFVRRIYEEDYKIFITGSNAKLLSSELSTHLTGRYKKTELYPFSFTEYLKYKKIVTTNITTQKQAQILTAFNTYLKQGGFPEYVRYNDIEDLQNVYNDIIYKDLIVRFNIRNQKAFKNLAHYLLSNFTKEISYTSLKSISNINNNNTIKDYIEYLQQSYLLFECYKFDYSLKKQLSYSKKIYAIDNGLRNSIAFRFNTDLGQLLENVVYIELKKQYGEVWFYKTNKNHEVDFCVQSTEILLFQVSYELETGKTRNREIRSLIEAMHELKTDKGYILTYNQFETIETENGKIEILPFWYYLTEQLNTK